MLLLKVLLGRGGRGEGVELESATGIAVPAELRRLAQRAIKDLDEYKALFRYPGSTGAFTM